MIPKEKLEEVEEKEFGIIVKPIIDNLNYQRNVDEQLAELAGKRNAILEKIESYLKEKPYLERAPIMRECLKYIDHTKFIDDFYVQLRDIFVRMINEMVKISADGYVTAEEFEGLKQKHDHLIERIGKPEEKENDKIIKFLEEARAFFEKKFENNELTKQNLNGFRINYYRIIHKSDFNENDMELLKTKINEMIRVYMKKLDENDMGEPKEDIREEEPNNP